MHFHSRIQAGRMLAAHILPEYDKQDCLVIALDKGGEIVGAEIAKQLKCGIINIERILPSSVRDKTILLVSDSMFIRSSIQNAARSIKAFTPQSLVIVTPLASYDAVHAMHTIADEIICLSSFENYDETNSYYYLNDLVAT